METTDPDLIRQYEVMASNFHGMTIWQHAADIEEFMRVETCQARTILDYGSGDGWGWKDKYFRHRLGNPVVTMYDPAVSDYRKKPAGRFDGVICCDVLEHIGEEHLDAVIAELFDYATEWVWASVCCRPAKKLLPDGRNPHVTQQPIGWWQEKFRRACTVPYRLIETP